MQRDFPGDASQEVAIEPREPFRAYHNQVRSMTLRGVENLFSGIPLRENTIHGEQDFHRQILPLTSGSVPGHSH
jgi:hypothetical protein